LTASENEPQTRLLITPTKAELFRPEVGHGSRVFAAIFERPAGKRSIRLKEAYGWPEPARQARLLPRWRSPRSVRRPKPHGFMISENQKTFRLKPARRKGYDRDLFLDTSFYGPMYHPNFHHLKLPPHGMNPHVVFSMSDMFAVTPNLIVHFMIANDGKQIGLTLEASRFSNDYPQLPRDTWFVPAYLRTDRFPGSNHEMLDMSQHLAQDIAFLQQHSLFEDDDFNPVPLWDSHSN
jgi:hypothetical protein